MRIEQNPGPTEELYQLSDLYRFPLGFFLADESLNFEIFTGREAKTGVATG